jgi:hypothetical protein
MGQAERMPSFPGPLRAAVGLVAVAAEEARRFPDRAIELPMLAVSTVLQLSVRAQQQYAQLVARGEDILNGRVAGDEPPPWATFDDPVAAEAAVSETSRVRTARADGPADLDDEVMPDTGPGADLVPDLGPDLGSDLEPGPGKSLNARRDAAPSRFDSVGDE